MYVIIVQFYYSHIISAAFFSFIRSGIAWCSYTPSKKYISEKNESFVEIKSDNKIFHLIISGIQL